MEEGKKGNIKSMFILQPTVVCLQVYIYIYSSFVEKWRINFSVKEVALSHLMECQGFTLHYRNQPEQRMAILAAL